MDYSCSENDAGTDTVQSETAADFRVSYESDASKVKEEWRVVPESRGFMLVSNLGRIRTLPRQRLNSNKIVPGRYLKGWITNYGYHGVCICIDGREIRDTVHRLVAKAFVPGYFEGAVVDHLDGNKLNNRWDNLEWVSVQENTRRAHENGLVPYFCKVPDLKQHAIKMLYQNNFPPSLLSQWFGVSESYVRLVSIGKEPAKPLVSRRKARIPA